MLVKRSRDVVPEEFVTLISWVLLITYRDVVPEEFVILISWVLLIIEIFG